MFFFFDKKNKGTMKIKKFYYFSPEKLKLIPIKNFIPKSISFLIIIALFFSLISLLIANSLLKNSTTKILVKQNGIIEEQYEKEINQLREKYVVLATEFEKLRQSSNDVRLAVNLETLEVDERNYGIGGSEFKNFNNYTMVESKTKLNLIYDYANSIETNLKFETSNYDHIKNKFKKDKKLFNCIPAISPINSAIGDRFGYRFHPILKKKRMHHGLDFLSNTGEKVLAPGDGVISYVGSKAGYGKVIRINHGYGYETIYAHLSKYKVKRGQKIKRGDLIALSGNSGSLSTGPHLHYEVRHNGVCLNPRNFIFDNVKLFDNNNSKLIAKK
jgi:murein DD-endopeptidase MepM/ murein hydrolase activator NlpD